jgi:hypothetical protein
MALASRAGPAHNERYMNDRFIARASSAGRRVRRGAGAVT